MGNINEQGVSRREFFIRSAIYVRRHASDVARVTGGVLAGVSLLDAYLIQVPRIHQFAQKAYPYPSSEQVHAATATRHSADAAILTAAHQGNYDAVRGTEEAQAVYEADKLLNTDLPAARANRSALETHLTDEEGYNVLPHNLGRGSIDNGLLAISTALALNKPLRWIANRLWNPVGSPANYPEQPQS